MCVCVCCWPYWLHPRARSREFRICLTAVLFFLEYFSPARGQLARTCPPAQKWSNTNKLNKNYFSYYIFRNKMDSNTFECVSAGWQWLMFYNPRVTVFYLYIPCGLKKMFFCDFWEIHVSPVLRLYAHVFFFFKMITDSRYNSQTILLLFFKEREQVSWFGSEDIWCKLNCV